MPYGWAKCECSIWRIVKFWPLKPCGFCNKKCEILHDIDDLSKSEVEEVVKELGLNLTVRGGK